MMPIVLANAAEWTIAAGTLGLAAATAALVVVAWKQLAGIREDSRKAEKDRRLQLRLATHPGVTVSEDESGASGFSPDLRLLTLQLENRGAGKAYRVEGRIWTIPTAEGHDRPGLSTSIPDRPPDYEAKGIGDLYVGIQRLVRFERNEQAVDLTTAPQAHLIVEFDFTNGLGDPFVGERVDADMRTPPKTELPTARTSRRASPPPCT